MENKTKRIQWLPILTIILRITDFGIACVSDMATMKNSADAMARKDRM